MTALSFEADEVGGSGARLLCRLVYVLSELDIEVSDETDPYICWFRSIGDGAVESWSYVFGVVWQLADARDGRGVGSGVDCREEWSSLR